MRHILSIALCALMLVGCTDSHLKYVSENIAAARGKLPVDIEGVGKLVEMDYSDGSDSIVLHFQRSDSAENLSGFTAESRERLRTFIAMELVKIDGDFANIFSNIAAGSDKSRVAYEIVGTELATKLRDRVGHDLLAEAFSDKVGEKERALRQAEALLAERSMVRPWEIGLGVAITGASLTDYGLYISVMVDAEQYPPSTLESRADMFKLNVVQVLKGTPVLGKLLERAEAKAELTITATYNYFHVHHCATDTDAKPDMIALWMSRAKPTDLAEPVTVTISPEEWMGSATPAADAAPIAPAKKK